MTLNVTTKKNIFMTGPFKSDPFTFRCIAALFHAQIQSAKILLLPLKCEIIFVNL